MAVEVLVELLTEYAVVITATTALISALVVARKKWIKPMISAVLQWTEIVRKIDYIFNELTPNGGQSIKDEISEIHTEINTVRERQRALSADGLEALFETDINGNCVWVNRTYTRVVGRDISEVLGHGWQNTIALEDRERVVTEWYKSVKEDREFHCLYRFIKPDGTLASCSCVSYKLTNKGKTLGYMGRITILDKK
jgi:PAS domain S-box-containing protein